MKIGNQNIAVNQGLTDEAVKYIIIIMINEIFSSFFYTNFLVDYFLSFFMPIIDGLTVTLSIILHFWLLLLPLHVLLFSV